MIDSNIEWLCNKSAMGRKKHKSMFITSKSIGSHTLNDIRSYPIEPF